MGLAEDFSNLGEELIASFDARVDFLGDNIVNTHRFLGQCSRDHKAMARKQRAALAAFVEDLEDSVDKLQQRFRREQRAVHQECKANGQAWKRVSKAMAVKRRDFNQQLNKAKQSTKRRAA